MIFESKDQDHIADIQGWAKEWALGCVNLPLATRGSQEAGFTQPKAHFAQPCTSFSCSRSALVFLKVIFKSELPSRGLPSIH